MKEVSELTYEEHQRSIRLCKATAIGGLATAGGGVYMFYYEAMSELHKTGFDISATNEKIAGGAIAAGLVVGVAGMIRSVSHTVYQPEDCPPAS